MPDPGKQVQKLNAIAGVRLASISGGIYPDQRKDMALLELSNNSNCAAVFTQNSFAAPPVKIARNNLQNEAVRYLLINSGNANAATGERGYSDALELNACLANQVGCKPEQILPFSTGVIGEFLPLAKMKQSIPELTSALTEEGWNEAAAAIMTTDTVAKGSSRHLTLDGEDVYVTGIAKGSGMIMPNMATMLAFVATNASVEDEVLDQVLGTAVKNSFNRITVDGDTSTNDACVLVASGHSSIIINSKDDPNLGALQTAINEVLLELAQSIIRDGEGASKFITVSVAGGKTSQQCLEVAYSIANSPLVKTAMFASDPNWGRIIMAIGGSRGEDIQPEKVSVYLNSLCIVEKGGKSANYTEEAGQVEMSKKEILVGVDLGLGDCEETVWTSDLSHEYVRINAEYRS